MKLPPFLFQARSHSIALALLELIIQPKLALNLCQPACLSHPSAKITSYHPPIVLLCLFQFLCLKCEVRAVLQPPTGGSLENGGLRSCSGEKKSPFVQGEFRVLCGHSSGLMVSHGESALGQDEGTSVFFQ